MDDDQAFFDRAKPLSENRVPPRIVSKASFFRVMPQQAQLPVPREQIGRAALRWTAVLPLPLPRPAR
jgi:hypothetical protein